MFRWMGGDSRDGLLQVGDWSLGLMKIRISFGGFVVGEENCVGIPFI